MLCVYFSAIVVRIVYLPFGLCWSAVASLPATQRSARNRCAAGLFGANFQIDQQPIRCSSPIRPCGPAGIGQIQRSSEYAPPAVPLSGVRVAEIALKISEAVPE